MTAKRCGRLTMLGLGLLGIILLQVPGQAKACQIRCGKGELQPTLVDDFNQASIVLVGTFRNAQREGGAGDTGEIGTTDFHIEQRLKDHGLVQGKRVIVLPRYLPAAKSKFIIFCDVNRGQIEPFRGVEIPEKSDLLAYLQGALALKNQPIGQRLRHCFDYLNSTDPEVSNDAFREFARAGYNDYKDMAKALRADKAELIAGWLQNPKTPNYRYGLYGSLLGLCGHPKKHGDLLRALVDDPEKRSRGFGGLLTGLMMLQPPEGWAYLEKTLKNEKEEFLLRYACLGSLRFFWSNRPDVFPKRLLIQGTSLALRHSDMADFAIEDLRKWQRWEMTPQVLALFKEEAHKVVKRAVLRFALQCEKQNNNREARAFVAEQRRLDAAWVDEVNDLLRLELEETPAGAAK